MRQVPFNSHQFLSRRLPGQNYFLYDILDRGGDVFAGGFFSPEASPFLMIPAHSIKVRTFLKNLIRFNKGVAELLAYDLILNNDEVRQQLRIREYNDSGESFAEVVNRAQSQLDAKVLIDFVQPNRFEMNEILKRHYGFDFVNAAIQLSTLKKTLLDTVHSTISPTQKSIIYNGPETLDVVSDQIEASLTGLHSALHRYLILRGIDREGVYPEIAAKIDEVRRNVREDLVARVEKDAIITPTILKREREQEVIGPHTAAVTSLKPDIFATESSMAYRITLMKFRQIGMLPSLLPENETTCSHLEFLNFTLSLLQKLRDMRLFETLDDKVKEIEPRIDSLQLDLQRIPRLLLEEDPEASRLIKSAKSVVGTLVASTHRPSDQTTKLITAGRYNDFAIAMKNLNHGFCGLTDKVCRIQHGQGLN